MPTSTRYRVAWARPLEWGAAAWHATRGTRLWGSGVLSSLNPLAGSLISLAGSLASWMGSRRRWWVTLVVLFALSAAWSLATPLTAAPDEPAQIIKAAAVVRGEFLGTPAPPTRAGPSAYVAVQVPAVFARSPAVPRCFAMQPDIAASCSPTFRGSARGLRVYTYVGRYPPLYYLVVGLPSLWLESGAGVRLMRMLSALVCCALLASAFESAASSRWARLGVLGLAIAVTPMVLFLNGTVNPNSVEIAAALDLWISGLVLLTDNVLATSRRLMARVGFAAAVLVEMRGVSWLWLGLAVVGLLALARRPCIAAVARDRVAWAWGAVAGASAGFSAWWTVNYSSLAVLPSGTPHPRTPLSSLIETGIGETEAFLREMVGIVGWLDTPAPTLTFYLWFALVALALGAGLAFGARRASWVLAGVAVATVAVPVVLQVPVAARIGFAWQGRYTLPLAVGIPVVAAYALSSNRQLERVGFRPAGLMVGATVVAQAAMFLLALRRYTVGLGGPLNPFGGTWAPPLGAGGATVLFGAGLLGYAAWLVKLSRAEIHYDDTASRALR
ncbi:MAG TPA: DUF2142 domain-containing protein [Acidimicrobiales bacterium]|nr:DUF2142 domain-containing protein [Acidimicrobiales bacterium]